MAVVQISKIQIRRGQEYQDGIPQLAGGEMAWAIDTQRLYIGNGAVSEGSPQVGNTRIITDADNLLDVATSYIYKVDDPNITTSDNVNYPVSRTLQDRLDERVTAAAYGIFPDENDQTENIQRAVDNLWLNKSNMFFPESRVTLEFASGTYYINDTIYLPSHVRIVGAGIRKTIFQFTSANKTVFSFIQDDSTTLLRKTISYPPAVPGPTYNTQPKYCLLEGFTVNTGDTSNQAIALNAVRDSQFRDLELTGGYGDSTFTSNSIGIGMYALSTSVTCQKNDFSNITFDGFANAVLAKFDIIHNQFSFCHLSNSRYGFNFGTGADLTNTGQEYGPRFVSVMECYFDNIDREGVLVSNGYGNKVGSNVFINVGNDGGGNSNNVYSPVNFVSNGNSASQNSFDRFDVLSIQGSLGETYLPEIEGSVFTAHPETKVISLSTAFTSAFLIRLPITQSCGYEIKYVMKSSSPAESRSGVITIATNFSNGAIQLSDEYDYAGSGDPLNIAFDVSKTGNDLRITYTNFNAANITVMTFSYKIIS